MKPGYALLFSLLIFASGHSRGDNDQLRGLLATDNHFALMRHALAPGTGDPSNFVVDDCSTQRNLDATGRIQATSIGEYLRAEAIDEITVYSSQWCRCLETAELLQMGPVTPLPDLNSFFSDRSRAGIQTRATEQWLSAASLPAILVTHQVNITALSGVYPASGEIIVMKREKDGSLAVAGSIELKP